MKKIRNFLLFGLIALLVVGCSGNQDSDKAKEDSIRATEAQKKNEDQKALEEAEAQKLAEQARVDSLRQDSIEREEKMRITPQTIAKGVDRKVLKKLGFIKKVDRKTSGEDEPAEEEMRYTRTFNGRRVDFISWYGGSSDNYFQFYDKQELNDFKDALLESGFKRGSQGIYTSGNHYIKIEGNKVRFDFDW